MSDKKKKPKSVVEESKTRFSMKFFALNVIAGVVGTIIVIIVLFFAGLPAKITDIERRIGVLESSIQSINVTKEENEESSVTITEYSTETGEAIKKDDAPFIISVNGTVFNSRGLYVYLVVNDDGAELVQPTHNTIGLGYIAQPQRKFSGKCHLGAINNVKSLNKEYRIYAVVTDNKYNEYDYFIQETEKARSGEIKLMRTH